MKDLAGQRFGRLVAVRPVGRKNRYVVWECKCDCGNTVRATSGLLNAGRVRSCGCLRAGREKRASAAEGAPNQETAPDSQSTSSPRPKPRPPRHADLAGRRFGRLVAIRPIGHKNTYALWECACDCGNTTQATTNQLTAGKVRSCGCLRRERGGEDLAGRRFGDLTALEPTDERERGSVVWRCLCTCGRELTMSAARLKRLTHPTCGHHA